MMLMVNKTTTKALVKSHKVRTFFASIAGAIAVYLILSSITVVWLNRTLTNTNTFVGTVGPLVSKPAVQNFIAEKVTDQLLDNTPTQDLAKTLLPANELKGAPAPQQLKQLLDPIVKNDVLQIVKSPAFQTLWENTNRTTHAALVAQLNNSNANSITLDLSPAINGVVAELKASQLKPVAKHITIKSDTGKLNIKSDNINRIHNYYEWFKEGTVAIVILTVLMIALSIWLSVHHGKTARRILLTTGILAILQGLLLEAPTVVKLPGNDPVQQAAAKAFAEALVHNLQLASVAIGVLCIAAAIGSKLYVQYRRKG